MQITTTHRKAIDHYYKELASYQAQNVTHETAVRSAFQNLLAAFAPSVNWTLIPEQALANGKRPDGTLRDTFSLPRGYWEAKDTKDDLKVEKCFPYYTYAEDGSNRRENITDWALGQFRERYGTGVSKWDIFHYVYGMLHHPQYRERYAENLKRELPRIPLLKDAEMFATCVRIGKQLMELHLHYEDAREYPLTWIENKDVPINWRVEKMRLTSGKDMLAVNEWLTLTGIPQACFQYKLGNRSALEWVIDQYQVSTDTRSGITSDPNRMDDERYIVQLVGKVVTVSVETVKLVEELTREVRQEDWMGDAVGVE